MRVSKSGPSNACSITRARSRNSISSAKYEWMEGRGEMTDGRRSDGLDKNAGEKKPRSNLASTPRS